MNESCLKLSGLMARVKVGCSPQERRRAARVYFDFAVRFPRRPRACRSDLLKDTICYASVCQLVTALVTAREFRLIEHLGYEVYTAIRKKLPTGCRLAVRVTKPRPPIPGVEGAAEFLYGTRGLL